MVYGNVLFYCKGKNEERSVVLWYIDCYVEYFIYNWYLGVRIYFLSVV